MNTAAGGKWQLEGSFTGESKSQGHKRFKCHLGLLPIQREGLQDTWYVEQQDKFGGFPLAW